MSRWRTTSRSVIRDVIAKHPQLVTKEGLPELFKIVSKAYPFGQRSHHPYKMWGKEVGLARRALERDVGINERNPLMIKCTTCGVPPYVLCRAFGSILDDLAVADDAELEGRLEDAQWIRTHTFHHARIAAVGLALPDDDMPLFSRIG
jgi:hypothetical protein